jgi:hypothetical protein
MGLRHASRPPTNEVSGLDEGVRFLLIGIGLAVITTYGLMRRGLFGPPGRDPMDDVRRIFRWAIAALAIVAVPMLVFVSIIAFAGLSVARPDDAALAILPVLLLALGIGLVATFVWRRLR